MKYFITAMLLFMLLPLTAASQGLFGEAPEFNSRKNRAAKAYINENYGEAAQVYGSIVDTLGIDDPRIRMNYASALYRAGDTATARQQYNILIDSENPEIKSKAYTQMGVLNGDNYREGLEYFKNALIANPENETARYNYELLKMLSDSKEQNKQQEPSDFAKQLKATSDRLVSEGRYVEAFNLMQQGLRADVTVSYYQDYIGRLGDVAEIEESK